MTDPVELELKLAQQWEVLVNELLDAEPGDAERLIAEVEEDRPATPWLKDQIKRAVEEAIRRRNAPKSHIPPGSGKTILQQNKP